MAIENYYRNLTLLKRIDINNGIGGKIRSWNTVTTIQGVINQDVVTKAIKGKLIEATIYKGYTEINENITANARIKDTDNKIYRIKGTPKNTMNMNHHYYLELEYNSEDNES
jgi:head-tail adaptor